MPTPIRAIDSIDLPFPPALVWPVLADVAAYPRWWPASLHLRVLSGSAEAAGTELEIRPGRGRAFRCRVEEVRSGEWLRMRYHGGFVEGLGTLRLAPHGDAGSRVSYEMDVQAHGWLVALLARFLDLGRIHSRQMAEVLQNLERRVRESTSAARSGSTTSPASGPP